MFGESESESPRVPSPWDQFLPSPPSEVAASPPSTKRTGIPKLVPEVEEGNVEYKLKLTQISPARFARLVTQLKWRLLEGGGQAYYELGVADSGALIGLTRADLEESLETLEMMAGEIGASVIVVKEIEVPPVMVAIADKISGYLDPETGEWANKMSNKRSRRAYVDGDLSTTPTTTETETDLDTADSSDLEDSVLDTPNHGPRSLTPALSPAFVHRVQTSNPNRPTAQSSPAIFPIDDDLALFSMEPEPSLSDTEMTPDVDSFIPHLDISVDLEISSVYKPRPFRKRTHVHPASSPPAHFGKRAHKAKQKKIQPWHSASGKPNDRVAPGASDITTQQAKEMRSYNRRIARDKRREEKRRALLVAATSQATAVARHTALPSPADAIQDDTDHLVTGLEALHVGMGSTAATVVATNSGVDLSVDDAVELVGSGKAKCVTDVMDEGHPNGPALEPRLIVEALVVRKLSVDEAYLDFGFLK